VLKVILWQKRRKNTAGSLSTIHENHQGEIRMDRKNTEKKTVKKSTAKITPVKKKALSSRNLPTGSRKKAMPRRFDGIAMMKPTRIAAHLMAGDDVQCSTCLFYVEDKSEDGQRLICSVKPLVPIMLPQQGTNVRDIHGNVARSSMSIQFFPCVPYRAPLFCGEWQSKEFLPPIVIIDDGNGTLPSRNLFDTRKADQDIVNEAERKAGEEIDKNTPS
jgi:hypothetical protein